MRNLQNVFTSNLSETKLVFFDKNQTNNLSLLDIVKHAVKTVAHVLGEHDRLAIVSYSSEAKLVSPLLAMTPNNRKSAIEKLEALQPDGMTNLWAGVKLGVESLLTTDTVAKSGRVRSVFVLTDGQPNVEPAVGHVKALERLYASNPALQASLHSFGFGYGVNSKLLLDMARVGRYTQLEAIFKIKINIFSHEKSF